MQHCQPRKSSRSSFGYRENVKSFNGSASIPLGNFSGKEAPFVPRQRGAFSRLLRSWFNRLMGGAWSEQESEYPDCCAGKDYVWNTIGFSLWGAVFPVLSVVATQLVGADEAGKFAFVFVFASLMMILGNFGVRVFQVSDIEERFSFIDYQVQRFITCIGMLAVGWIALSFGDSGELFSIVLGVYLYRVVDALADVYEGRLQQMHKLYLAGISQSVRSAAVLIVASLALALTRNIGLASISMAVVAALTFVLVTLPLSLFETPKSRSFSVSDVLELTRQCSPLYAALFLYALIDNLPKFAMVGVLSFDSQLYFNALYFPAQAILLSVGFIYKPLLVKMAQAWGNAAQRRRFDIFIVVMMLVIVGITLVNIGFMAWVGIPIMSFMYGIDFEQFRSLAYIMLCAGGLTGAIEFLYQVITILRRQSVVPKLYLVTFAFSLLIVILLVHITGLPGAVVGYLIVMTMLFALLVREYVLVRLDIARTESHEVSSSQH